MNCQTETVKDFIERHDNDITAEAIGLSIYCENLVRDYLDEIEATPELRHFVSQIHSGYLLLADRAAQ